MASIDKRPSGHYRARWREFPGGPQKTRQFKRKVDAENFIDGIRGDLVRGCYGRSRHAFYVQMLPYTQRWLVNSRNAGRRGCAMEPGRTFPDISTPNRGHQLLCRLLAERSCVLIPGSASPSVMPDTLRQGSHGAGRITPSGIQADVGGVLFSGWIRSYSSTTTVATALRRSRSTPRGDRVHPC